MLETQASKWFPIQNQSAQGSSKLCSGPNFELFEYCEYVDDDNEATILETRSSWQSTQAPLMSLLSTKDIQGQPCPAPKNFKSQVVHFFLVHIF